MIFSSVKISTYTYYNTNKTLSFIYHLLYADRFVFLQSISPPQKELFNYRNGIKTMPLHYIKKHLRKTILFYIIVTVSRGTHLGVA